MLAEADRSVAERDPALPGLRVVLDYDALSSFTGVDGVAIEYVRYKRGASCLVGYTDACGQRYTAKTVARTFEDKWRAARRFASACDGTIDDDHRVVLTRFPHDRDIRGLPHLAESAFLSRMLTALGETQNYRAELLVYKPERRCVAAVLPAEATQPVAAIKVYERSAYDSLRLDEATDVFLAAVGAPRRLQAMPRRCAVAHVWCAGTPFAQLAAERDGPAVARDIGAHLALLHRRAAPPSWQPHSRLQEIATVRRIVDDLTWVLPPITRDVERLGARVVEALAEAARASRPIHGDYYAKQVLVSATGVHLLDFDEAAIGDPLIDVANFVAHLELDALRGHLSQGLAGAVREGFLDAYANVASLDAHRLRLRVAEALLRLAPHPFRHRNPRWPELTEALLAAAHAWIDPVPRRANATVQVDDVRALAADPPLAFAAPLLDPLVAQDVLARAVPAGDRMVTAVRLLRHKRGRRCVLAFDVMDAWSDPHTWLGKVRSRGLNQHSARLHAALWSLSQELQDDAVGIPRPLGVVEAYHMTLQAAVEGVSPLSSLAAGVPAQLVGSQCAAAVRWLHRSGVPADRRWTVEDELAVLHARFADWFVREAGMAERASRTLTWAVRAADPLRGRTELVTVHRDFYHDQLLVAGSRCWLLDLDTVAHGDPALDLGNFAAHALEATLRGQIPPEAAAALVRGFLEDRRDDDGVARFMILSLVRLTEIASRIPDRRHTIPALLAALAAVEEREVEVDAICDAFVAGGCVA